LIGDVSAYAALQAADAIRDAARNPGTGGAGAAVGVGIAMAGQLATSAAAAMKPGGPPPTAPAAGPTPPPIPPSPGFFVAVDGKAQGPFDIAALRGRVAGGQLTADTLVWRDGMAQWTAASAVTEVAALFGTQK
jgi:hypothetical protein